MVTCQLYCNAGFANLTTLSLRSSNLITAVGMRHFANLINLKNLDLERCPYIHGGLIYLKGVTIFIYLLYLQIYYFEKTSTCPFTG